MKNSAVRILTVLAMGGLLLGLSACHKNTPEDEGSQSREKSGVPVEGKPTAPVKITSDVRGLVEGDRDLPMQIRVQPERGCSDLVTTVYGIDGVEVRGDREVKHPECAVDRPGEHRVTVRVPRGVAGYVVTQVKFEAGGRMFSATQAFPVQTEGATPKKHSNWKQDEDSSGRKVLIMESSK